MIRQLQPLDKEKLCLLSEQINRDHYINMPNDFREPDGSDRDWEHWQSFADDASSIFLVAERDGNVEGFIACRVIKSGNASYLIQKTKLQISTIVVLPSAQRKDIGRKLVEAAIREAKELGATEAFLEVMSYNVDAQKFYEALGFDDFSKKMSFQF